MLYLYIGLLIFCLLALFTACESSHTHRTRQVAWGIFLASLLLILVWIVYGFGQATHFEPAGYNPHCINGRGAIVCDSGEISK